MKMFYRIMSVLFVLVVVGAAFAVLVVKKDVQQDSDLENIELSRIWISGDVLVIADLVLIELTNRQIIQFLDSEGNELEWEVPEIQDTFNDNTFVVLVKRRSEENVIYIRWKPIRELN